MDPEKFLELRTTRQKWRASTKRYALSRETGYPGIVELLSK